MKKPSITACVITKNEAAHLPQWLRCVKQLTSDLVLVDTGSTDETVAMAEAGGAKVYHFAWIDDFAAAKNAALEHAKGDWIVFLDADEYFDDNGCKQVLEIVREYHANPNKVAIITPLVNLDENGKFKSSDKSGQVRIFRNSPNIRYSGAIHEALFNSGGKTLEMQFRSDVKLYHTGYTKSSNPQKMRRNLEILQNLTDTESLTYKIREYYMTESYYALEEYDNALAAAETAMKSPLAPIGWKHRPYLIAINAMGQLGRSDDEIEEVVKRGEAAVPHFADFRFYAARTAWNRRHYLRAMKHIDAGMAIRERMRKIDLSKDEEVAFRNSTYDPASEAHWYLGQLARWRGGDSQACEHFLEALRLDKHNTQALYSLCDILQPAPADELISLLNGVYDKVEDARFLADALANTRHPRIALYYNKQAGGDALSEVKQYWAAGHGEALGAAVADEGTAITSLARYLLAHGVKLDPALWALMPEMPDDEAVRQTHYEQSLECR